MGSHSVGLAVLAAVQSGRREAMRTLFLIMICSSLFTDLDLRAQESLPQPAIRRAVAPRYPRVAQLSGTQGTVVAVARVGERGEIVEIEEIGGPAALVSEVKRVLPMWRCEPCAEPSGKCKLIVKFSFVLSGLCTLPECVTEVYFDHPNTVVVESQVARAIVN